MRFEIFILLLMALLSFNSCRTENKSVTEPEPIIRDTISKSGIESEVLVRGSGKKAVSGSVVLIHESAGYRKSPPFYSTKESGIDPIRITLGGGQVIKGLEMGIVGMEEGELRKLTIPPTLSKRNEYPPFISPDSILVYTVELIQVIQ